MGQFERQDEAVEKRERVFLSALFWHPCLAAPAGPLKVTVLTSLDASLIDWLALGS